LLDIDDSLSWEGQMPRSDRPNPSWWRLLDERSAAGGRAKAWLFLTHPGPSILVTAVLVAAAGLLGRQLPSARTAVGLVLVMLPTQLAIGALNDWADWSLDFASKPFKPIACGAVPRRGAIVVALTGFAVSLGAAASLGVGILLADAVAIAAGVSYDLWLKRTAAAVLAWWAGFATVPLMAMAVTGRLRGGLGEVPLAGLLALALLLANGLPDREGDERGGAHTLPSVLGARGSRLLLGAAMVAAAGYMLALREVLGQGAGAAAAAALLAAGALVAVVSRRRTRLGFPLLALLVAAATVSWLAALPAPGAA
jgi:4-hydroxybenzoate polyprenyltransferase